MMGAECHSYRERPDKDAERQQSRFRHGCSTSSGYMPGPLDPAAKDSSDVTLEPRREWLEVGHGLHDAVEQLSRRDRVWRHQQARVNVLHLQELEAGMILRVAARRRCQTLVRV